MRAFHLATSSLLIVFLSLISTGVVYAEQSKPGISAKRISTKKVNKRSPSSKKKKTKKKRATARGDNDEIVMESPEEKRARLAMERKHRARRKALAEDHLQNERIRERETRRRNQLRLVEETIGGSFRLEGRHFPERPIDPNSVDSNLAMLAEVEMNLSYKNLELKIWNLGRYDLIDGDRSRFLPYENWLSHKTKSTVFKIGMQIENWSMTEIFHPSDVFNSRNFDSDLENTEKIGEPAASLRVDAWGGFATFFYMPIFWSPIFPSSESRISALPVGGKILDSIFLKNGILNENDSLVNQYAFRYTRKFGSADLAVHYLNAIDRQAPIIKPDLAAGGFRPVFLPVKQMGFNGSIIDDAWIYKFDIVNRSFTESAVDLALGQIYLPDHNIAAVGLERSISFESGTELTLFGEWQKILGVTSNEANSLSLFQNDIMFGGRISFNDLNSKELKAYAIIDLADKSEMLWALSYSQKLSQNLKVSGGYRSVAGRRGATKELNDADHLFLNLTYFFER